MTQWKSVCICHWDIWRRRQHPTSHILCHRTKVI